LVELKNVTKVYENETHTTCALDDVNIKINKGEFVFIVGASGAGKSTFLKLLMREETPTKGTIIVKDYDLGKLSRRQIPYYRRTMGIVFQDFRLIPTMSVYDNVAFAMRVINTKEKVIRNRVPQVINMVGLKHKAHSMPNELSGGEQQRVALARALANNADIIIADEPTGNVDPQMSYEIVELLTKLNETGTTVIMVTHAHDLVRKFNHRVIILNNGKVVADGKIDKKGGRRRAAEKSAKKAEDEKAPADEEAVEPEDCALEEEQTPEPEGDAAPDGAKTNTEGGEGQ